MQTCNCSNTFKYNDECVVCGETWETKTLSEYILELKELSEKISFIANRDNDLTMRDKHCLVRDIYTELEDIAKERGDI
jgi:hypothetical protein